MEDEVMRCEKTWLAIAFKDGKEPQGKEWQHPLESGQARKQILSQSLQMESNLANTLILAQWYSFCIADLPKSKVVLC